MEAASKRFVELDALRGIAAISVVIYHYFYRYNEIYGHRSIDVNWAIWGEHGVELFFMVSGFVIFWTLNKLDRPVDFIVSRFSRLYPAFWIAVLVTYSVISIFGLPGREVPPVTALLNLLMFHEYLHVVHVDGAYWTLSVELTFYFWMFVTYLFGGLKRAEWLLLVAAVLAALHALGVVILPNWMLKIFILKQAAFFLAGICFYKMSTGEQGTKSRLLLLLSLLLAVGVYSWLSLPLFLSFYVIFLLAVKGRMRALRFKPLVHLGLISYSLYLLHQNVGYVIINEAYALGADGRIAILVALGAALTLAYVLYRVVEIPALTAIRRLYRSSAYVNRVA